MPVPGIARNLAIRDVSAVFPPESSPLLTQLKVGQFRCFETQEVRFEPGTNLITGPNARGKTSLLEAVCVLLRLQSPRAPRLADLIRHGQRGLLVDGFFAEKHLQF